MSTQHDQAGGPGDQRVGDQHDHGDQADALLVLALLLMASAPAPAPVPDPAERWFRASAYVGTICSDTLRHAARAGHIRRRKLPGGMNVYHDGDVRARWCHLFDPL